MKDEARYAVVRILTALAVEVPSCQFRYSVTERALAVRERGDDNRRLRATYYTLIYDPIRLNAFRHRAFTNTANAAKVHLGPGKNKYLDGWINVDANFIDAKIDIWADLNGALPFKSGIIDAFYSHHMIEHVSNGRLPFHFSEMFRCLKKGGII